MLIESITIDWDLRYNDNIYYTPLRAKLRFSPIFYG